MKLIIDIPNEGYDWIKNGFPDNEDKEFLIKAVKNGTPCEERPQDDLISRSYLKQMIPTPIEDEYKYVHRIIDNAPTVYSRQGEWIDVNGDGSLWKCNNCGEMSCCKGNYCPDCGTKMKEGVE